MVPTSDHESFDEGTKEEAGWSSARKLLTLGDDDKGTKDKAAAEAPRGIETGIFSASE